MELEMQIKSHYGNIDLLNLEFSKNEAFRTIIYRKERKTEQAAVQVDETIKRSKHAC